jgi:probable rRNA maturation factor
VSVEVMDESSAEVDVDTLQQQAEFLLRKLGIHPEAELSVLLVDEAAMTELHVRWMDEPGSTDVLSFPMDELRPPSDEEAPEPGMLGDVVICPQVAQRQAGEAGHATADELALLLTHGLLHLLGHDHAEPDEHAVMFALQDRLLASWGALQHDAGGPGA